LKCVQIFHFNLWMLQGTVCISICRPALSSISIKFMHSVPCMMCHSLAVGIAYLIAEAKAPEPTITPPVHPWFGLSITPLPPAKKVILLL
jgi:hypothetical protein